MERTSKYFFIIAIFFTLFAFAHTEDTISKKVSKLETDLDEEIDEEVEPIERRLNSKKKFTDEPEVREDKPNKSISLDDLIEIAKKHKAQATRSQPVKKMEYIAEKLPYSVPDTSTYQSQKGIDRNEFFPIENLPKDYHGFAIQFICSKSFIHALSCLISGQKNLTTINLERKEIESKEKIVSLCKHLTMGNSIVFFYIPKTSQNKVFGLHLSHLVKNRADKDSYNKRGLSKHASGSRWAKTIAYLPTNKKVSQQCSRNKKHCIPLTVKIENCIYKIIQQQKMKPLEGIRDLFDHGNGLCSVKQIKLSVNQSEKNMLH